MSGHTPGPWEVFVPDGPGYLGIDTVGHDKSVVVYGTHAGVQRESDAKLIAAAPDLLLSLQILERYTSQLIDSGDCGCWSSDESEPVTRARDAISKATSSSSAEGAAPP